MKDIDTQTDSNQIQFAPTGYSPYDIFDDDWPRFTMSRSEITQMAATAPQELVEVLGTGDLGPIEEISFDFRSVAITRPWFRSGVFTSRFWRLPAGMDALSDGAEEATGRCPAYVSAVVFARNISITSRPEAVNASPPDPRKLMLIDRAILAEKRPEMAAFISLPAPAPVAVKPTSMNLAARLSAVRFSSRTEASPTAAVGTGPGGPALRLAAIRRLVRGRRSQERVRPAFHYRRCGTIGRSRLTREWWSPIPRICRRRHPRRRSLSRLRTRSGFLPSSAAGSPGRPTPIRNCSGSRTRSQRRR